MFMEAVHGMVDIRLLRDYLCRGLLTTDPTLPGIVGNIESGRLLRVALTASSCATGDIVTFSAVRKLPRANRRIGGAWKLV